MDDRRRRRWYSVSVDTLRWIGYSLLAFLLAAGGYLGWRSWQQDRLDDRAADAISEAGTLIQQLQEEELSGRQASEYLQGVAGYREARRLFDAQEYAASLVQGRRSRDLLRRLAGSLASASPAGEAQFLSVSGDVQYRRGASGPWQRAKNSVRLSAGDSIRTGPAGSAEIVFRDSTFFTVRPNSLVVVSNVETGGADHEQAVEMVYGWVDLSTSDNPSTVSTPGAEARVASESEGFVSYEQDSATGRFGAFSGGMRIESGRGEARDLAQLEQVLQRGEELSVPRPLPARPELVAPGDHHEIRGERADQLVLTWQPVADAAVYALQVSESPQFVDNVVEDLERPATRATLGIRGPGSFVWRVAAKSADGAQGPWSEARRFTVRTESAGGVDRDRTPPALAIVKVTPYGNLYIVDGRTEPGARVDVNEEPVKVETDGSFTKTVSFTREGWASIDVRALDAWGNAAAASRPVYVESP